MRFTNRVILQGYLDIECVDQAGLMAPPIVRGSLWTDENGVVRHRVVLADRVALGLISVLRKFNLEGGSALLCIDGDGVQGDGAQFDFAHLDGKLFVSIEGQLLDGIVNVKHISLLSTPSTSLLRLLLDHRLRELVHIWDDVPEPDKSRLYRLVQEIRQEIRERPSAGTASRRQAPVGAHGGVLPSTPPAGGRESASPLGGGTVSPPDPPDECEERKR